MILHKCVLISVLYWITLFSHVSHSWKVSIQSFSCRVLFEVLFVIFFCLVLHPVHQGVSKSGAGYTRLCTALLIPGRSIPGFSVHCSWWRMCVPVSAWWTRALFCFWWTQAIGPLAPWISVFTHKGCKVTQQVRTGLKEWGDNNIRGVFHLKEENIEF